MDPCAAARAAANAVFRRTGCRACAHLDHVIGSVTRTVDQTNRVCSLVRRIMYNFCILHQASRGSQTQELLCLPCRRNHVDATAESTQASRVPFLA